MADPTDSALKAVTRAVAKRDQAKLDVELAMVAARAAGCTLKAIADAAGITHPMVIQILKKHQPA